MEKTVQAGRELLVQPSIGVDSSEFSLGEEWRFFVRQTYIIMRAEMPWRLSPKFKLTTGLDFAGGSYDVDFLLAYSPDTLASSDPLAESDSWTSGFSGWGWSPDPWVDLQIRPLEEPDKLILIPGIRLSTFLIKDTPMLWGLDPRFQARWKSFQEVSSKAAESTNNLRLVPTSDLTKIISWSTMNTPGPVNWVGSKTSVKLSRQTLPSL